MSSFYGPGSGPIWVADVRCTGTEESLAYCGHRWDSQHIVTSHSYDISINCRPGLFLAIFSSCCCCCCYYYYYYY